MLNTAMIGVECSHVSELTRPNENVEEEIGEGEVRDLRSKLLQIFHVEAERVELGVELMDQGHNALADASVEVCKCEMA